jgi:hypothetical protein
MSEKPIMRAPIARLRVATEALRADARPLRERVYYAWHALSPMVVEDFPSESHHDFMIVSHQLMIGEDLRKVLYSMTDQNVAELELRLWRLAAITALIAFSRGTDE